THQLAKAVISRARKSSRFNAVAWNSPCKQMVANTGAPPMVLKMERVADGETTILRLSGRIQSEHLSQLQEQIEAGTENIIMELDEVKLVDRDVVCYLRDCEAKGIVLSQCPLYIREWIDREKSSAGDV